MKDCPLCSGTGWRPIEKDGLRTVAVCDCRKSQRDEEWWMDRARIPRRHRRCSFDNFDALNDHLQMVKIKARGYAENYPSVKEGLLFLGNPGVGKTHLAVAILKQLMFQKGVAGLFCAYQELLQRIRDSYNPVSLSTESEVLQPVLNTEVVVIDDLGANRITDWVEDTVTYILNYRYNEKKATILTSNLPDPPEGSRDGSLGGKYRTADTLVDRIGVRVRSRLYEMCEVVNIHADDFRKEVRAHQE
jgi:DNA replication protein DnaC